MPPGHLLLSVTGIIQTGVSVASLLVAITALYVAYRVEQRNQRRFNDQLRQSRIVAEANVKPLLYIYSQTYVNLKSVKLANRGSGIAVMTTVEFSKNRQTTRNMAELFNLGTPVLWDTSRTMPQAKYYLRAGDEIDLVKLSMDGLLRQNLSEEQASVILAKWQDEKRDINVVIEYEDIFGTRQPHFEETLI